MTWPMRKLSEIAAFAMGQAPPSDQTNTEERGTPFYRSGEFGAKRPLTRIWTTKPLRIASKSDVFICVVGANSGEVNLGAEGAIGRSVAAIRPATELDQRFLFHFLTSLTQSLRSGAQGSAQGVITKSDLGSIEIPLPPLDEQRRIVNLLEDHLSRFDAASIGLSNALSRLVALEQSALDAHFGRDQSVSLAELIEDISAGKSFGASNAPARNGEWGIIKVSAMTWGDFKPDENKAVPADRIDPRFEIREGDLLVSRANTSDYVGASVLVGPVRSKLLLSDKSLRVTPNNRVRPDWLWRALQAPSARRQISALATGTKDSMRNISQTSLRRILLPKASLDDQGRALSALADVKESSDRLRREVEAHRDRTIALRQSLLAAAFSGRLSADTYARSVGKEMIGA